jgi:hypothetical protein
LFKIKDINEAIDEARKKFLKGSQLKKLEKNSQTGEDVATDDKDDLRVDEAKVDESTGTVR